MQNLISDDNHHYKISINPYRAGAVLLERTDLNESREFFSLLGLPKVILIAKRTF